MKINLTVFISFLLALTFFKIGNAQNEKKILNDKILIVVHMQEEYAENEISKESTAKEIEIINKIISTANPENVVYAKSVHKILNFSLKKIYVDKIAKDLDDRLEVVGENVFTDYGGNVFNSDELVNYVNETNINQIVIVGRVAEECITKSVLSGKKSGFEMFIIPDAIIGKSKVSKFKAIKRLKEKGVKELTVN